ncbi:MAG: hypothetical protein ACR2FH_07840, partial [Caulobacteraceae bacterium]
RLEDAYECAGFAPGNRHAARMAALPEVAERTVELRAEFDIESANDQAVIAALLRLAQSSEALATPAGIKEARLTLLEARNLRSTLARDRNLERNPPAGLRLSDPPLSSRWP